MTLLASKLRAYATDPAAFRADVNIDANGQAVRFGDVIEPWQEADFRALDPGWRRCIGLDPQGEPRRGWLERGRGHSKTSDIALMALWALAFAPSRIAGIIASGDQDQARIVAAAVQRLLDLNPVLTQEVVDRDTGRKVPMLSVQSTRIRNALTGSTCEIITSDSATSYGHLVDFLIADEIANWPDSGEALWIALASTIAKRLRCMVVVITNSGLTERWQYKVRMAILASLAWYSAHLDGPQASWITAELLAEQAAILPPGAYRRLWLNEWIDGSGDALDAETVRAAVRLDGPPERRKGVAYVGGLDLSTRRDHSAFVILGADQHKQRVELVVVRTWKPHPQMGVDLSAVRSEVSVLAKRYQCVVRYDPHQAHLLAQDLQKDGVTVSEYPFTGAALNEMASVLLQQFREGKIDLYDDAELIGDLLRLTIEERSFGFRLSAPRDATRGHCDRAMALAIALPKAVALSRVAPLVPISLRDLERDRERRQRIRIV